MKIEAKQRLQVTSASPSMVDTLSKFLVSIGLDQEYAESLAEDGDSGKDWFEVRLSDTREAKQLMSDLKKKLSAPTNLFSDGPSAFTQWKIKGKGYVTVEIYKGRSAFLTVSNKA
jgi:prefoldin subunit 5